MHTQFAVLSDYLIIMHTQFAVLSDSLIAVLFVNCFRYADRQVIYQDVHYMLI